MTVFSNLMYCPHCAACVTAHGGHGEAAPVPDDFTFCWQCKKLAVFTSTLAGMMLRLPTAGEMQEAFESPEVHIMHQAVEGSRDPLDVEGLFQRNVGRLLGEDEV